MSSWIGGCATCSNCSNAVDLTIEQQVGQMFIIGFDGTVVTPEIEKEIKELHPGGILLLGRNIESKEQVKKLIADLQAIAQEDTGLPLLIAVDQEGGVVSRIGFLKEKTHQADIIDGYRIGYDRGKELEELGINLNLAPLLDEVEENDFIFNRASLREGLAKEIVRGQKDAGIFSCIKHFPGYKGIDFNPEEVLAFKNDLPEIEQFKNTGAEFVMTANVVYGELGDLPFTFSKKGIEIIKRELGSSILIISDDLDQHSLLNKYSLEDIVVKPVQAGVDILIFSGWRSEARQGVEVLLSAVKQGKVEINIDRIVELRKKLK